MRWFPVARQECQSLLESRGVWLLTAILPLWTYRPGYETGNALGSDITISYLQYAATLVIPMAVILLCYRTIVGERESGSLKFLLGLPLTRRELFVSKVVGRTAGIVVPTLVGLGIVTVVGVLRHGLFSPLQYLAVLGATLLYVIALVSLVVSVSAVATRSITAAGTLVIGVLVSLELLWNAIAAGIREYLQDIIGLASHPTADGLLFFLLRLSPSGAYNVVTNWILGVGNSAELHSRTISELEPNVSTGAYVVETSFDPGTIPFYLHEAGGLLILLAWAVVPILIASSVFTRGDLA